jgi:outer membrane lipoprotein-sorting protein
MKLVLCLLLALGSSTAAVAADRVGHILKELDSAAAKFQNAAADFDWRTVQTEPISDTATQAGTIYFTRSGDDLRVSVHIRSVNQRPAPKVLGYSNGSVTLYEPLTGDFKVYKPNQQQEPLVDILLLGFGSSGADLARKWNITFVRQEILGGVKCEILQLIPKNRELKKHLRSATVWLDASRGVTLKQILDEDHGMQRLCLYTHLAMNTNLPPDAFNPKAVDAESPRRPRQ